MRLENLSPRDIQPANNPIDLVEDIAAANAWAADRQNDDELAVQVTGQWCDLQLWFAWHAETRSLFISCALDMRVPEDRRDAIYPLLAKINERLWIGHFDLSASLGLPGQFDHADFQAAVRRTAKACKQHKISLGMIAGSPEQGLALIRQGFNLISYSGDVWLLRDALGAGITAMRDGLNKRRRPAVKRKPKS